MNVKLNWAKDLLISGVIRFCTPYSVKPGCHQYSLLWHYNIKLIPLLHVDHIKPWSPP